MLSHRMVQAREAFAAMFLVNGFLCVLMKLFGPSCMGVYRLFLIYK